MAILLTNIERNHFADREPRSPYWSDRFPTSYEPYLEFADNRPNLVICLGDSWTWGDSLVENLTGSQTDDPDLRRQHVYGRKLAALLDADFVNCAIPGVCNDWMLDKINVLLNHDMQRLQARYHKVYIVVTLTEIGRDLSYQHYVDAFESSYQLSDATTGEQLVTAIEKFDFDRLKLLQSRLPANFQLIVGRNFTYTQNSNTEILDCLLSKTWVELLFDAQNFVYNKNVAIMSFGIENFNTYVCSKKLDSAEYKQWFVNAVSKPALAQIKLLNCSRFNFRTATKHPTSAAHQLWAEYIFSEINKGNQ